MRLYNSLTKTIEEVIPLNPPTVGLYTCGPTVYDYSHIGHGRKYVNDDILKRALIDSGYQVKHVENITDVGHLVSDADEGEDKLEKGAAKTGQSVWEVALFYTRYFLADIEKLNILPPAVWCKATEHIQEQVNLIKRLFTNGLAYDTPEAVYFDVTKFAGYTELFGQKLADKQVGVREEVKTGEHKKHAPDFALWFKRVGRFADHSMHWPSPWGDGFPGWHLECSAMSMHYLGEQFDIHTGGEDHLSVHHPNEIAQSEGATGKPFVSVWVHYNFLRVDGKKMSKSLGNFFTIDDVVKKGVDPLALRYFYLTSQYRSELNFTWEALADAARAYGELKKQIVRMRSQVEKRNTLSDEKLLKVDALRAKFDDALASDMNTPQALAVVWELIKSNIPSQDKYDLLLDFDDVLGFKLSEVKATRVEAAIPEVIRVLVKKRETLRRAKQFDDSDKVREEILRLGYEIEDTSAGTVIRPRKAI